MISKITKVRLSGDRAAVEWVDERGQSGTTEGEASNAHMQALIQRAQREGVTIQSFDATSQFDAVSVGDRVRVRSRHDGDFTGTVRSQAASGQGTYTVKPDDGRVELIVSTASGDQIQKLDATFEGGQYAVKCDECKKEIRRTDSLRESAAGGKCDSCRAKGLSAFSGVTATCPYCLKPQLLERGQMPQHRARIGECDGVGRRVVSMDAGRAVLMSTPQFGDHAVIDGVIGGVVVDVSGGRFTVRYDDGKHAEYKIDASNSYPVPGSLKRMRVQ